MLFTKMNPGLQRILPALLCCVYLFGTAHAQQHCTTPSGGGTCMDKSLCTGNKKSIAGYCPGAAGIQCCVSDGVDVTEVIGICISVLSTVSSASVLLTGYVFYDHMVKGKQYMKMILIMSACACLGSLSMVVGYPTNSKLCAAQGFMYIFFFRASWLWCLMLTIVLYQQLNSGVISLSFPAMNYILWGINILFQFLPFAGNDSYGLPDTFIGRGFCSLGAQLDPNKASVTETNGQWLSAMFFYPLCISAVGMILLDGYLYYRLLPRFQSEKIEKLVKNIVMYPVGMFCFWVPTFLILVSIEINKDLIHGHNIQTINALLTDFAAGFGLYLTIIFFWKSAEARKRWHLQFRRWGWCGKHGATALADTDGGEGGRNGKAHPTRSKDEVKVKLAIEQKAADEITKRSICDYNPSMDGQDVDASAWDARHSRESSTVGGTTTNTGSSARDSYTAGGPRHGSSVGILPDFELDTAYEDPEMLALRPSELTASSFATNNSFASSGAGAGAAAARGSAAQGICNMRGSSTGLGASRTSSSGSQPATRLSSSASKGAAAAKAALVAEGSEIL